MTKSFQKLVRNRRSIRRYADSPVEREKILTCLEAARWAPSADNVQPWRFLVIDEPGLKDKFAEEVFSGIYSISRFASKAPVLLVLLARLDVVANRIGKQIQGIPYYFIDIGIAGEHIVLQAEELGLGTCWIGWFNTRKARKVLNIPRKYKIVSLLTLGYYEKRPAKEKRRKELSEIVWFNEIGQGP
ncbi:MAG: nitroreductase family protein [Candidatus Aminicenantes bacterium]|jgi:nitroreductase